MSMQSTKRFSKSSSTFASAGASLVGAVLLAACGGGGSDSSSTAGSTSLDDGTATAYSADATQMGANSASATDNAVLTAQSVITLAAAASAGSDRSQALSLDASPLATASTTVTCAGGGTATVSISGGAPASLANGKFDAGEVYSIVYAKCKGALGYASLDGGVSLTVLSASGDSSNGTLGLTMVATGLTFAVPNGSASLSGSVTRTVTAVTDTSGTTQLSSHFTSPSLALTTTAGMRTSTFTLSAMDIQRTAVLMNGAIQSSTITGTHTVSAVTPSGSFSYTAATSGSATYASDGTPLSGAWTVTLPNNLINVSIANSVATITVDNGKDGTIDRTIVVPVPLFVASAG
jgi:hypothetical protein